MRRREFVTLLGGAATAWPLAARAQQAAIPAIGYLNLGSPESDTPRLTGLRRGLNQSGYVEGRNLVIEYRWAEGHHDRLPALAADLARRQVTVIAANSQATIAAKAITSTIPIVFITGADPVQVGFITSLNRPGGNLTGVTSLDTELGRKRLQLLHELLRRLQISRLNIATGKSRVNERGYGARLRDTATSRRARPPGRRSQSGHAESVARAPIRGG